jgi:hypothetical protein
LSRRGGVGAGQRQHHPAEAQGDGDARSANEWVVARPADAHFLVEVLANVLEATFLSVVLAAKRIANIVKNATEAPPGESLFQEPAEWEPCF